jgi:hypothetical protein
LGDTERSFLQVEWEPHGKQSDPLSGIIKIDWIAKRDLSFNKCSDIYNLLNKEKDGKVDCSIRRIGRPVCGLWGG